MSEPTARLWPEGTVLIDVPTAAQALGVAETACWDLVGDGQLRSFKVGRRRLVPIKALDEFVDAQLDSQGAA